MEWLFLAIGLAILVIAGEAAVRGAVGLARKMDISPAVIGAIVIGFGTSAPELLVSIQAALAGQPDLAVGNIVGSNISNLLLILGAGALIHRLSADRQCFWRDGGMMLLSALALAGMALWGSIERWQGLLLVAVLMCYIAWSLRSDNGNGPGEDAVEALEQAPDRWLVILPMILAGLAGLVGGAHLLVEGAVGIARNFGVPESIIGLTIVAVGTSLPELAATITAALRRQTDLALGNIFGSCSFNVLSILGITAIIQPLPFAPDIAGIDIWVMLAATLAVFGLMAGQHDMTRWKGGLLLLGYIGYMVHMTDRLGMA